MPNHLQETANPKTFSLALYLCLLLLIASLSFAGHIRPVSAKTIHVYPGGSIQDAVNSASSGDTIIVDPGTYHEQVRIPYTLTNLVIIGNPANPATTIVDGMGTGTVFLLEQSAQNPYPACNHINITGFAIRNAGDTHSAISSQRSNTGGTNDYHNISRNIITSSEIGISLGTSHHNIIADNTFLNNSVSSIEILDADYNEIKGNTIQETAFGVRLISNAIDNIVINNTISRTSYAIHVSSLSTGNNISQNTVSGRTAGIYVNSNSNTADHNTATESAYGILFYNCKSGTISYNTLKDNSYGIRLWHTSGPIVALHTVKNNKAVNNDWAIELTYSSNNTLTGNWLQQNTWGISLLNSPYNTIYHNNFRYNTVQASSNSANYWNKTGNGNHWSNWVSPDVDPKDGIVDDPYLIPAPLPTNDYFPLVNTWSEHDVSVESVTPSTNSAYAGATVTITVKVKNKANTTVSETFTVTTKYNSSIIGTQTVNPALEQGTTRTLSFNWGTTGVTPGNYTISAIASIVPNELNTDNNKLVNGTVKIKVHLIGDINDIPDDKVNFTDLNILNQAFGSTGGPPPSPNWNQNADINKDNIIDARDLQLLSKNFGKTT